MNTNFEKIKSLIREFEWLWCSLTQGRIQRMKIENTKL